MAHARRKVFDARDNYPIEASYLLARFQQLYDIESRAKAGEGPFAGRAFGVAGTRGRTGLEVATGVA